MPTAAWRCAGRTTRRGKTAGLNAEVPTLTRRHRRVLRRQRDVRARRAPQAGAQLRRPGGRLRHRRGALRRATPTAPPTTARARTGTTRCSSSASRPLTGSMVGGDGAIYAIRRPLWQSCPRTPSTTSSTRCRSSRPAGAASTSRRRSATRRRPATRGKEYRRRVRIVSRSWRAVFQAAGVLNPFRVGLFACRSSRTRCCAGGRGCSCSGVVVGALGAAAAAVRRGAAVGAGRSWPRSCCWPWRSRRVRHVLQMAGTSACSTLASLVGVVQGLVRPRVRRVDDAAPGRRRARHDRASSTCGPAARLLPTVLLLAWLGVDARERIRTRSASCSGRRSRCWSTCSSAIPLLLVVAAHCSRLRPRRQGAPIEPSVCLLIAANDEEDVIAGKLQNSLALDYPRDRLRVVVASDGSRDRTNAIVRRFAGRRRRAARLSAAARQDRDDQRRDAAVTDEIVVFSDANTFLRPDAVRRWCATSPIRTVGAVSGDVVLTGERAALARSEDLYYRYERWLQRAESELGSMVGVDGALYAIRRELFEPPPADTILDDMAIPMAVIRRATAWCSRPRRSPSSTEREPPGRSSRARRASSPAPCSSCSAARTQSAVACAAGGVLADLAQGAALAVAADRRRCSS